MAFISTTPPHACGQPGAEPDPEAQEGGGWMRGCEGRWGHCLQEASALKGQAAEFEQSVTRALPERRDQNLGEVGKESFASKEAAEMSLKTLCIFNSIFPSLIYVLLFLFFLHLFYFFLSFFFFFFLYFSRTAWYGSQTRDQTWTLSNVSTKS